MNKFKMEGKKLNSVKLGGVKNLQGEAAGKFIMPGEINCNYCDGTNTIPDKIEDNSLSSNIKKIPLHLLCQEAGLSKKQECEIFRAKQFEDFLVKKHISIKDYNEELLDFDANLDSLNTTSFIEESLFALANISNTKNKEDELFIILNNPKIYINELYSDFFAKILAAYQQFKCDQKAVHQNYERLNTNYIRSAYINDINRAIHNMFDNKTKENNHYSNNNTNKNILNICRKKDPFLREVNSVIYDKSYKNILIENTKEYYDAAQNYAIFGSIIDNNVPKANKNKLVITNNESKMLKLSATINEPKIIKKKTKIVRNRYYENPSPLSSFPTRLPIYPHLIMHHYNYHYNRLQNNFIQYQQMKQNYQINNCVRKPLNRTISRGYSVNLHRRILLQQNRTNLHRSLLPNRTILPSITVNQPQTNLIQSIPNYTKIGSQNNYTSSLYPSTSVVKQQNLHNSRETITADDKFVVCEEGLKDIEKFSKTYADDSNMNTKEKECNENQMKFSIKDTKTDDAFAKEITNSIPECQD